MRFKGSLIKAQQEIRRYVHVILLAITCDFPSVLTSFHFYTDEHICTHLPRGPTL